MSNINVFPSQLMGTISAPPSKSDAHRAIICAALSREICRISPIALSDDIQATIGCIEALGAKVKFDLAKKQLEIDGSGFGIDKDNIRLDCGESGSTLRFFVPIIGTFGIRAEFFGSGRLPNRPIGIYSDLLPTHGVNCRTKGGLPLKIDGKLKSGKFELRGDVSSQFITGLILALPLLEGDSEIVLTSPLESRSYVNMTVNTCRRFGIKIKKTENGWLIPGGQTYKPCDYTIEGDWSQAAFWLVGGAISGDVTVTNLSLDTAQGDKEILNILKSFGADISENDDEIQAKISGLGAPKNYEIDAKEIPDLVPIIAVLASCAEGCTKIINAGRLRLKESDRLKAISNALNALGARVEETQNGLEITGVEMLKPGKAEGKGDHRIVMSAAIAGLVTDGRVTITDVQSVSKSYPSFFSEYERLGGRTEE